jgi:hypothetical protein
VTSLRSKIAVYAPSVKLGYRDLLAVNAFQELASRFDVVWLFSGKIPSIGIDDHATARIIKTDRFRYRFWLGLHSLVRFAFDDLIFSGRQKKPAIGLRRVDQLVLAIIIRFRLSSIAKRILRFGLEITSPDLSQFLKGSKALLCFGSAKDLLFDDLVRSARKLSMPVIMIPLNWDNATSKPYIERPGLILTWGTQTSVLSASLHGVKSLPVGSPRFDFYRGFRVPTPPEAKKRLGLRCDLQYVMFAGAGFPFVEIESMRVLADTLKKNGLNDVRIVYRPHPYSWSGFSKSSLGADLTDRVIFDPSLELFAKDDIHQYAYILPAISALVTPFSTIAVEAAFHRIPTLCIAFDDPSHTVFDWKLQAQHQPHLRIFNEEEWPLKCFEIENLEPMFMKLLDSIGDPTVGANAFRSFQSIVHSDDKRYVDRLCDIVESELRQRRAF